MGIDGPGFTSSAARTRVICTLLLFVSCGPCEHRANSHPDVLGGIILLIQLGCELSS